MCGICLCLFSDLFIQHYLLYYECWSARWFLPCLCMDTGKWYLSTLVMIGIWAYGNVYTTYCVNRCSVNSSSVNYRSLLFVNENVYMSFCWYYISVLTTAVFYKWAALFYTLLTSITFAFLFCTVCKIIHIVAIIGSAITVWIQCLKHLFHITLLDRK